MISDLCNRILERPNAVDLKTLIEEIKRVGSLDLNIDDSRFVMQIISNDDVAEEYSDLLEELINVTLFVD